MAVICSTARGETLNERPRNFQKKLSRTILLFKDAPFSPLFETTIILLSGRSLKISILSKISGYFSKLRFFYCSQVITATEVYTLKMDNIINSNADTKKN